LPELRGSVLREGPLAALGVLRWSTTSNNQDSKSKDVELEEKKRGFKELSALMYKGLTVCSHLTTRWRKRAKTREQGVEKCIFNKVGLRLDAKSSSEKRKRARLRKIRMRKLVLSATTSPGGRGVKVSSKGKGGGGKIVAAI